MSIKHKVNARISKGNFILYFSALFLITGAFVLPPIVEIGYALLFILICSIMCYKSFCIDDNDALTRYVVLTIFFSTTQNVYLGLASPALSEIELQILLTINITVVALALFIKWIFMSSKDSNWLKVVVLLILLQTSFLWILYPVTPVALISSFRNIVAPLIMFSFFSEYGNRVSEKKLYDIMITMAWFVVLFGLAEYFCGNEFWIKLNIEELWTKKGIGVASWSHVPMNWYSSEMIGGVQLRRMVSTFADPVNLGTYLFAMLVAAWYKKKMILMWAIGVACVLTVSKGALLGFIIFAFFYFWYKDKSKWSIPMVIGFMLAVVVGYMTFSKRSSTGSVNVHLQGFLDGLKVLVTNPLGFGVGRVGVMAFITSNNLAVSSVTETGVGAIFAQLGLVGAVTYIIFFSMLIKRGLRRINDKRQKIVYFTLFFSYLANMMFNEVALSPNSCGVYFAIIGIISTRNSGKTSFC